MEDTNENAQENVLKFPNANYALFNDNTRKSMRTHITKMTQLDAAQADDAIYAAESGLAYHLTAAVRTIFSKLGERCARSLFEN